MFTCIYLYFRQAKERQLWEISIVFLLFKKNPTRERLTYINHNIIDKESFLLRSACQENVMIRDISEYFEKLETELQACFAIASEARKNGEDPSLSPEILPARDLAERVENLSLIHISEPTRLGMISYAVFC